MSSAELARLAEAGHLQREPPSREEIEGLVRHATARLADAHREELSPESRFDLAYNAAHALALAALRRRGYRTGKRYFVFLALPHTLGTPAATWRLLAKCHELRNRAEYEGLGEIDATLLAGLLAATDELLDAVNALPAVPDELDS